MVLTADSADALSRTEDRPNADIHGLMTELDRRAGQLGPYHPETVAAAHQLAIAFWRAGDTNRALGILNQALEGLEPSVQSDHPVRLDLLGTVAEILAEQGELDRAAVIYRDVLQRSIRSFGENHSNSLAAKGDLSLVLFELGNTDEAAGLETEAYVSAQEHLGREHCVTCALAWTRALRFEATGNGIAARAILADELAWLLTKSEDSVLPDQRMIRAMLSRRLLWDAAPRC
jgi:tetratricopeptide (TPR) repeat protein